MKPFIGIDLTEDKKNEQSNGDEFLVQKPSEAMRIALEQSSETLWGNYKKALLPLLHRVLMISFGSGVVLIAGGIEATLAEGYRNTAWIFGAGAVCLSIFGILLVVQGIKVKKILKSEEYETGVDRLDKAVKAVEEELGVPSGAKETDILGFFYKMKDGEPKPVEKWSQTSIFVSEIFSAYADGENLYLSNMDGKYAFPLSSLKAIRTVKKRTAVGDWNKDDPMDSPEYKPYKLTEDGSGNTVCRQYHVLELERDGEAWGIWYPSYENPTFEELTGLKAEEAE